MQGGLREAEAERRGQDPHRAQGGRGTQGPTPVPRHDGTQVAQRQRGQHQQDDEEHGGQGEHHDRCRGAERVAEQTDQRAGVRPVDDGVEGAVQREVEAHVEGLGDHHQSQHDPDGHGGDVAGSRGQQRCEGDEHEHLERQAHERCRAEVLDPVGQGEADPDEHDREQRQRRGEPRVDHLLAVPGPPQPPAPGGRTTPRAARARRRGRGPSVAAAARRRRRPSARCPGARRRPCPSSAAGWVGCSQGSTCSAASSR